uniref:Zinc finger protein 26 n=1 Tax=Cacopsylla melanoneura TaxID=428564 RepID=A0A8D9EV88_9HEMI
MRRHLREVHSSNKRFVCDICGKQFSSSDRVNQHRNKLHFGLGLPIEKKFECHHCNMKFSSKFFVSEHINTHTGYKPYKCQICGKTYGNIKSYNTHMKRHKQEAGQLKPEEIHKCNICNKVFLENSRLTKHHAWVHGDKYHECKICGAKLKGNMQKHMLSHTGEKPYCCHICGKSMRGKLKEHMLTHTGERPHACDVCGSTFKYKYYLTVHMRKHTGEKPYQCQFCDQSFASRPSFTLHLKKHNESSATVSCRPHQCQVCSISFSTETDLKKHLPDHFGSNK